MTILFPILSEIQIFSLLISFLFGFFESVECIGILYFMANIYLEVSTHCACHFVSGLSGVDRRGKLGGGRGMGRGSGTGRMGRKNGKQWWEGEGIFLGHVRDPEGVDVPGSLWGDSS